MTIGNIDKPAPCKECGVVTTLDSIKQICWDCWCDVALAMEQSETMNYFNEGKNPGNEEE